jgi:hypothetical protein
MHPFEILTETLEGGGGGVSRKKVIKTTKIFRQYTITNYQEHCVIDSSRGYSMLHGIIGEAMYIAERSSTYTALLHVL